MGEVKVDGRRKTLEQFRVAVRFLLVTEYGMPELVVEEVLDSDAPYVARSFEEHGAGKATVAEVAEELAIRPRKNQEWVRVGAGHLLVQVDGRVRDFLDRLVGSGLYGENAEEVASALIARGIEVVLPVLPHITAVQRH